MPSIYPRWTLEQTAVWQQKHGWLVGCNYTPAYAGNQLEMWQPETFDLDAIDRELALAESIGFNSLRVFLHDILWTQDRDGFIERFRAFLDCAEKHGIGVMAVFFDSVWHPQPKAGPQPEPKPGLHNSVWLQSPGRDILQDPFQFFALEAYVVDVMTTFKDDPRIQCWDLWNEASNSNLNTYDAEEVRCSKPALVAPYLAQVFTWARSVGASQPLTAGLWDFDQYWDEEQRNLLVPIALEQSDVISFHNYSEVPKFREACEFFGQQGRPLICTEFMARTTGSTFQEILPVMKELNVHGHCWGFVDGRTQTKFPWSSWQEAFKDEPTPWHHDIFHADHTPYSADEVACIRQHLKP